jgi:hypothetical protein
MTSEPAGRWPTVRHLRRAARAGRGSIHKLLERSTARAIERSPWRRYERPDSEVLLSGNAATPGGLQRAAPLRLGPARRGHHRRRSRRQQAPQPINSPQHRHRNLPSTAAAARIPLPWHNSCGSPGSAGPARKIPDRDRPGRAPRPAPGPTLEILAPFRHPRSGHARCPDDLRHRQPCPRRRSSQTTHVNLTVNEVRRLINALIIEPACDSNTFGTGQNGDANTKPVTDELLPTTPHPRNPSHDLEWRLFVLARQRRQDRLVDLGRVQPARVGGEGAPWSATRT